jgi:acetyl-CoA synthetase
MDELYPVPETLATHAHADTARYEEMYAESIRAPEIFWGDIAKEFVWMQPWETVKETSFTGDVSINWFKGGKLNITESCIDRHAAATPEKIAIIW